MRAISLWEPWASAIAYGLKQVETRGWSTDYRGLLAIHAAKTTLHAGFILDPAARPHFENVGINGQDRLAFGCIVAVCKLSDCQTTERLIKTISMQESLFGNYSPERYGWILTDVHRLVRPIPYRGKQGFFQVPDNLLAQQVAIAKMMPPEQPRLL